MYLRLTIDIICGICEFLFSKDSRDESISSNTDVKRKAMEMDVL